MSAIATTTPSTAVRPTPPGSTRTGCPSPANRQFKARPAHGGGRPGAYFTDSEGRKIFDGLSGLWCSGPGPCRRRDRQAVAKQAARWTIRPPSSSATRCRSSWPTASRADARRAGLRVLHRLAAPGRRHRAEDGARLLAPKGQGGKTRPVGRERATTASTSAASRWAASWPTAKVWSGRGGRPPAHTQPPAGTWACRPRARQLADRLLDLIALHDASNIAAVIVEPFSGSAGVVIPPVGYLQRLREICTQNNILADFRRGHHRFWPLRRHDRQPRPLA